MIAEPTVEPNLAPWNSDPEFRAGYVAVVGRPNVGKSSLVNLFVGRKVSIVSPRPQTTRRRILGVMNSEKSQAVFLDTPGIHRPKHRLGQYMLESAVSALTDADCVLAVVDASCLPGQEDRHIAELLENEAKCDVILVMNKMDRLKPEHVVRNTEAYVALFKPAEWMMTNALRGHNKEKLWKLIEPRLPLCPPLFPPDQITDQPEQTHAAELIREKALIHTYQEVPHSVAVMIEQWKEEREDLLHISATFIVERDAHKGILIGHGGQMIKQIGQEARLEMEEWLGKKVFLELWVKVKPKWRNHPALLNELEYR
ncbi:MAG: GTPase Era [Armatimonadetes bacterium]|nr:GTPase Era [Armatimonadota bacterium]